MTHMPKRWPAFFWLMVCGLICWLGPAWGRDATVTLNDGRQFTGEVVSDNVDGVVLKIAGINTPFKHEDVKSVVYLETIEQKYAEQRALLDDNDVDGRYKLAQTLYDNHAYTLAQHEVADLLRRFPTHAGLLRLSRDIDQKLKLQAEPRGDANKAAGVRPPLRRNNENPNLPGVADQLTDEQINLLRVYEVEPARDHPRVEVNGDAVNEILDEYAANDDVPKGDADQQAFRLAPGWQQLELMFKLHARNYYNQAKVMDDPALFAAFRVINQRYVMNYCGTDKCHGGENAKAIFLFRSNDNSTRVYYTNYFILYQYKSKFGYMLDASEPSKSLLVQYGLRRSEASSPHPAVPGWDQRFHGPDDETLNLLLGWIKALPKPRLNYGPTPGVGINYTPPMPKAVVVEHAGAPAGEGAPGMGTPGAPAPATRQSR